MELLIYIKDDQHMVLLIGNRIKFLNDRILSPRQAELLERLRNNFLINNLCHRPSLFWPRSFAATRGIRPCPPCRLLGTGRRAELFPRPWGSNPASVASPVLLPAGPTKKYQRSYKVKLFPKTTYYLHQYYIFFFRN